MSTIEELQEEIRTKDSIITTMREVIKDYKRYTKKYNHVKLSYVKHENERLKERIKELENQNK